MNKIRDQSEPPDDTYDDVYTRVVTEDGKKVQKKVNKVRYGLPRLRQHANMPFTPKAYLDLTDSQNREFRHVL